MATIDSPTAIDIEFAADLTIGDFAALLPTTLRDAAAGAGWSAAVFGNIDSDGTTVTLTVRPEDRPLP